MLSDHHKLSRGLAYDAFEIAFVETFLKCSSKIVVACFFFHLKKAV